MNLSYRGFSIVFLLAFIIVLAGCQQEGKAEKAGKKVDKAAEKAGEALEKAGEKAGDAVEKAGDKMIKRLKSGQKIAEETKR